MNNKKKAKWQEKERKKKKNWEKKSMQFISFKKGPT